MKKRLMALFAVLSLGLVPTVSAAVEAPATDPAAPAVVMVKAYSEVVAISTDAAGATSVEFAVEDAYTWVDGTDVKVPAPELNGQRIVGAVTPETRVFRNDKPIAIADLQPGMKLKALLTTDVQPVAPTNAFTLREVYHSVPKPNQGLKFEGAFFPRLWHTRGEILGMDRVEDRNILNVDVRNLENTPKRFRDERARVMHLDAYVIVPEKVVITGVAGNRIAFADLQVDDRIKIVGKYLRPDKWMKDESGDPTPTLLAKRIKVKAQADPR